MTRARRGTLIAALLAVLAVPVHADGGIAANRGTCTDGSPRTYLVVDGTSTTDCTTGGGANDVNCCCLNGAWAACGSGGGGGNSFETIDASAGTNPVADSSTDTLTVICLGPLTCPGDSTTDTLTFSLDAWDVGEIVWSSITTTGFITSGGKVTAQRIPQGTSVGDGAMHINPDSATTPLHASFIYTVGWNTPDVGLNNRPALADLDSDGDLDLLLGETVGVSLGYENTGSVAAPVWAAKATWNTADIGTNSGPTFGDLDADGDLDLMIGSQLGIVYGYENTGSVSAPTWAVKAAWNTVDIGAETLPFLADFDTDGDLDLMVGEAGGIAYAYRNTGTTSAPAWTAVGSLNSADIGTVAAPALFDSDLDGDLDLYIGANDGNVYSYKNTGTVSVATWTRWIAFDIADIGANASPAIGDLDGDGDNDAMIGEYNGVAYGQKNVGSVVSWATKVAWDTADFGTPSSISFGDLDGDGDSDFMYGNSSGVVLGVENTGTAYAPSWAAKAAWDTADFGVGAGAAALADLDGDGDIDLMGALYNNWCCHAYKNTGSAASPTWTAEATWDISGPAVTAVAHLADLDGDGDYDFLEGSGDGNFYGYKNTGSTSAPTWSYFSAWNVGVDLGSNARAAISDLDGDGDLDLLASSSASDLVYGFENTGSASAPTWTRNYSWRGPIAPGSIGQSVVGSADLDADGDHDLLVQSITYNVGAYAYENTGSGSSSTNNTLLGVGVNGSQLFRVSGAGNIETEGDARIDGTIMVGDPSSSVSSGCIAMEATKDRLYWDRDCDGVQDVSEGHLDGLGAKGQLIGKLIGANFNVTTDQSIPMQSTSYIVEEVLITNASISLTTAAGGVYTAASKGGSAIIAAATVYTSLTAATKYYRPAVAGTGTTDVLTGATLYFSLTTAQGAAATADIYVFGTRLD